MTEQPSLASIPEWGQQLSAWNATLWRTSVGSPMMRSAMTGLLLLDRAPDFAALVERMDRVTRAFPALRERIVAPVWGIGRPRLVADPEFDLDFHLAHVALPTPGSWQQLLGLVRRESMADLDRDRPLWRAILVEGLPGGRSAFILVIHHAIADGQGALMIAAGLLDDAGVQSAAQSVPEAPEPGRTDRATATAAALADGLLGAGRLALGTLAGAPRAARDLVTDPLGGVGGAVGMAGSVGRVARVHRGPMSPLMRGRGARYSTRTLDVPFAGLREASRATGATMNDMLLAALTAGLRRYHEVHGTPVSRLRFNVPVSYRAPGQEASTNAASVARLELEVAEPSLVARLTETRAALQQAMAEPALGRTELLGHITRALPTELLVRLTQGSDVTASNVPGMPTPVALVGARVERMYPFVPTFGAAANVTMLSYARQWCSLGVDTDDRAIPDPDVFLACLAQGFAEVGVPLGELAANPAPAPPTSPPGKGRRARG